MTTTSPDGEPSVAVRGTTVGDELRSAEERIFAAIAARDVAALECGLTGDFVHTPIGGAEQDREAFLAAIGQMPYRILELRGEGLQARVLGDVAILSGVQRGRVALPDGQIVTGRTAFVDVFVSHAGSWRLRHACSIELPADASG